MHHSPFKPPDARFSIVHIDLVGSRGFTYLLTCVDRFTRWPEAIPLTSITAEDIAQAFLTGWIARFGVPTTIVTDRGRQFESKLWQALMSLLGSKRARTTAYHPQSNGLVERFHRQLMAALKAQLNPSSWMDALPLVLLGIRTALRGRHIKYYGRDSIWNHTEVARRVLHSIFYTCSVRPFRLCVTAESPHATYPSTPASSNKSQQSSE